MPDTKESIDRVECDLDICGAKLDSLNAAEKALKTALYVEFEKVACLVEAIAGTTVDRAAFNAYLGDGLSDAFHDARKQMEDSYDRLIGRLWSLQMAEDRAERHEGLL